LLFDAINLDKYRTFVAYKGGTAPSWIFINQKERLEEKEILAGTLHHYVKTLKMFVKEQTLVSHRRKLYEVFQKEEDTQMTERLH
jgi:hypothetical protein